MSAIQNLALHGVIVQVHVQFHVFHWRQDNSCKFTVQEQLDVIGLNLSAFEPLPGSSDFLSADQLMNSTKAPEEYDPEELYDPADTL